MGDRYEHQGGGGPVRWWRDVSLLVGRSLNNVFAQVTDILDRENRILGCISLCDPLVLSVDLSWSGSDGTTYAGTMTGTIT